MVIGGLFFFAGRSITGMAVNEEAQEPNLVTKVSYGMTKDEVIGILGSPDLEEVTEIFSYEDYEITFVDGKVVRIR